MSETTQTTESSKSWWETSERFDSEQAAAFFGMKKSSFFVARCQGRLPLPTYRFGNKDFFKRSDCLALIESKVIPA